MAQMNIDLDRLGKIGQEDLKDEKTQKRIFQYLYQLSEQLKYWQYHMEEDNMTEELRAKIDKAAESNLNTLTTSITDEGIIIKDREGNVVMMIGENGDMSLKSVTADDLTVGGRSLGTVLEAFLDSKIVVSDTQPAQSGVIWVQPQGSGSTAARYTGNGNRTRCMSGETNLFTFTRQTNGGAAGSTCKYGIRFRVLWGQTPGFATRVRVQATGTDESSGVQTVTILDRSLDQYIGANGYLTVDTTEDMSAALANVTYGTYMTVRITVDFDDSADDREFVSETFTLTANSGGLQGEVKDCAVKYVM